MDPKLVLQRILFAAAAIFVIAAGICISPLLKGSSLYLAVIAWLLVLIGYLHAAEVIPWLNRFEGVSQLLHAYAPPLSEEEKSQIKLRRIARENERRQKVGSSQKLRLIDPNPSLFDLFESLTPKESEIETPSGISHGVGKEGG
jgi:hypothetical protein